MSVKELQALTRKFADAFDQRDLKTFLAMLSVLTWRSSTTFRISVRRQAALRQVCQRGRRGLSLSELRLPATIVSRVRRYRRYRKCLRHVYGRNQRRQGPVHPRPNDLGLPQTERAVEDCQRPLLCNTQGSLENRARGIQISGDAP